MKRTIKQIDVWHFAGKTLRDGTPLPAVGQELPPIRTPVPCERGYHGSARAIDALAYVSGFMVARCRLFGAVPGDDPVDKYAARRRVVLSGYVDSEKVIRQLAAKWAHRAIAVHAAAAMRNARLADHADKLAAIKPWDWRDTKAVNVARRLAGSARSVAHTTPDAEAARWAASNAECSADVAECADGAARVADVAMFAWNAAKAAARSARAAGDAACAADAGDAALAAAAAGAAAGDAAAVERDMQSAELESALRNLLGIDHEHLPRRHQRHAVPTKRCRRKS